MRVEKYSIRSLTELFKFSQVRRKRALIVVGLSICPGLGQVFNGRLLRGIILFFGLVAVSWLSAIMVLFFESQIVGIVLICLPAFFAILICIDAVTYELGVTTSEKIKDKRYIIINMITFLAITYFVFIAMDYAIGKNVVRALFVTSESMSPQIYKYDLVLVDKIKNPKKGDIIHLRFDDLVDEENVSKIIKNNTLRRIIATGGDRVELRGRDVYVNNIQINENYIVYEPCKSHSIYLSEKYQWGPDVVPKDSFFVLADSRLYGFDSRTFGFVNKNRIGGIAIRVIMSWNMEKGHFMWDRFALAL